MTFTKEVTIMHETVALLISLSAMLSISLLASGGLYLLGVAPAGVIFGGTLVGLAVYLLFWAAAPRYITAEVVLEEQASD